MNARAYILTSLSLFGKGYAAFISRSVSKRLQSKDRIVSVFKILNIFLGETYISTRE